MQDSSGIGVMQRQLDLEDDELSCAVSLSLQVCKYCLLFSFIFLGCFSFLTGLIPHDLYQTAEQEKAMRELVLKDKDQQLRVCGLGMQVDKNDCSNRKVRTNLVSHLFIWTLGHINVTMSLTIDISDLMEVANSILYLCIISSKKRYRF